MNNLRVLSNEEEVNFLKAVDPSFTEWCEDQEWAPETDPDCGSWRRMRNMVAVLLMLDAGVRVGELVQLRITDLIYNNAPVRKLTIRAEIAKRKEVREVPISDRLYQALRRFCPGRLLLEEFPFTQKLMARNLEGKGITTRAVEKMTKKAGVKAFGEPVNPHMLRHTFATKLMRITDMATVQALLGHKNLSSTSVYTHPNSDDKARAIAALDKKNGSGCKQRGDNKGENGDQPGKN